MEGTRLGSVRVTRRLGEGTLSEVFEGVQEPLGRPVAVKVLKASVTPTSPLGQRFLREGELLGSMAHQNIPQVYETGAQDGRSWLVLELVDGWNLASLMKKHGPFPPEVASAVALRLARALEYVHLQGVLHRDVKPSNVLVGRRGEVKLVDFGLARAVTDGDGDGLGVVGTPSYMSPEQVLGDRLDYRSDVFSFGIVFYELLTGCRPFVEEPARTVMQKIRLDRYVPPRRHRPGVPRTLERVLGRCLEKNPAHRYPSTGALCDDLNEFLSRAGILSQEARLITFLRDAGELDAAAAREALGPAGAQWTASAPGRDALRAALLGQCVGGALLALVLGATELSRQRRASQEPATVQGPRAPGGGPSGALRVLARPWAEVSVDGVRVDTTPFARAIQLAPGTHFVRLRNPLYHDEQRAVTITPGATVWIDVDLSALR
ncbi:MAG: serine/threonine protein kinase [Deltaproteobacteria bacterium]|nr:serine/threonine protein kinase [Deltaproteobacteria bacterium]